MQGLLGSKFCGSGFHLSLVGDFGGARCRWGLGVVRGGYSTCVGSTSWKALAFDARTLTFAVIGLLALLGFMSFRSSRWAIISDLGSVLGFGSVRLQGFMGFGTWGSGFHFRFWFSFGFGLVQVMRFPMRWTLWTRDISGLGIWCCREQTWSAKGLFVSKGRRGGGWSPGFWCLITQTWGSTGISEQGGFGRHKGGRAVVGHKEGRGKEWARDRGRD